MFIYETYIQTSGQVIMYRVHSRYPQLCNSNKFCVIKLVMAL